MAYPFEQAPTIKQFADRVKADYGCSCEHIDGLEGPRGAVVISYLTRQLNGKKLISEPLPENPDERLARETLRRLSQQLRLDPPPYPFLPGD